MTEHELRAMPDRLQGYLCNRLEPILTIEPGDRVRILDIPDASWHDGCLRPDVVEDSGLTPDSDRQEGHCLIGPIAVKGAEPGMTLSVHMESVTPADTGWTIAGGWSSLVNERLGLTEMEGTRLTWDIDHAAGRASSDIGGTVAISPFLGVMAVGPGSPGRHSTITPGIGGGNLDCRELVAGSTLYLPVQATGALFSCGDGHAAQGDGELSGTAIECAIREAVLVFDVSGDWKLSGPVAQTPAGWVTFGIDPDLETACLSPQTACWT